MSSKEGSRQTPEIADTGRGGSRASSESSMHRRVVFYYPASRMKHEDEHSRSHDLTVVILADRRTKVQVVNRNPEGVLYSYENIVFGADDLEISSQFYHANKKYTFKRLGYSHYKNAFSEAGHHRAQDSLRNLWDLLASYGLDSDALAGLLQHTGGG